MDMESLPVAGTRPSVSHKSSDHDLYDGISWLDEDDNLDLRLTLDDYNADLKTSIPRTKTGPHSMFRRRLSGNKLSFGRSSVSSNRTDAKEPCSANQPSVPIHSRRKSRALSLITPKNGLHDLQVSAAVVDTAAAHYQDPEARHTLRAYLASPQKFDEALKFGFPANIARSAILSGGVPRRSQSFSRDLFMASSERLKTFLADDSSSIYSDETSLLDPDSPLTPQTPDTQMSNLKYFQPSKHYNNFPSKHESYRQGPLPSREMTLRMTLTRPELRSHEEQFYGWPTNLAPYQPNRPSLAYSTQVTTPVSYSPNKEATKESIDQIFADIDRELSASSEGVVKRLWNRVRRL
ncbi:hypothetical protein GGS21DRAFT_493632 [Xylaria nigripes]|nr:hypothetical protein GGS21DRAFT_493632 [Xylaria nigripes]